MEPENNNETVDRNVAPEGGEDNSNTVTEGDSTNAISGTVQIEIPSADKIEYPDANNRTAVDEVTSDMREEMRTAGTIAEESNAVPEAITEQTPTADTVTAVPVTEETPETDSTGPMAEGSNGNKATGDIEQATPEQQQQQQQQAEDTKVAKLMEIPPSLSMTAPKEQTADNSTVPSTEVTETQPANKPVRSPDPKSPSPSPTRSSLSRKESRSKHNKRVSFTGPKETLVKFSSETKRDDWPLSADFTAELGEKAVCDYVRDKWEISESWLHCVDYMGEQPPGSSRHQYRVKFSQPTRRRPIPAQTASVYFTLLPARTGPVGVWWVMEGQRALHRPGESLFREKWLSDILEAKSIICSETLF